MWCGCSGWPLLNSNRSNNRPAVASQTWHECVRATDLAAFRISKGGLRFVSHLNGVWVEMPRSDIEYENLYCILHSIYHFNTVPKTAVTAWIRPGYKLFQGLRLTTATLNHAFNHINLINHCSRTMWKVTQWKITSVKQRLNYPFEDQEKIRPIDGRGKYCPFPLWSHRITKKS